MNSQDHPLTSPRREASLFNLRPRLKSGLSFASCGGSLGSFPPSREGFPTGEASLEVHLLAEGAGTVSAGARVSRDREVAAARVACDRFLDDVDAESGCVGHAQIAIDRPRDRPDHFIAAGPIVLKPLEDEGIGDRRQQME